jgi:cell filamentation protein
VSGKNDDPYVYPGTFVLKNKLGIRDAKELDYAERERVTQRTAEGAPGGDFDMAHLRAIHRHLFQDVYEWAGELRRIEIAKDGHQFQFRQYMETGMADVQRRLVENDYLRFLSADEFSRKAGIIIGDVNYVHPFRDGNGRTQLQYLKLLGERAGHALDLTRLGARQWNGASRAAHRGDYEPMGAAIISALAV